MKFYRDMWKFIWPSFFSTMFFFSIFVFFFVFVLYRKWCEAPLCLYQKVNDIFFWSGKIFNNQHHFFFEVWKFMFFIKTKAVFVSVSLLSWKFSNCLLAMFFFSSKSFLRTKAENSSISRLLENDFARKGEKTWLIYSFENGFVWFSVIFSLVYYNSQLASVSVLERKSFCF